MNLLCEPHAFQVPFAGHLLHADRWPSAVPAGGQAPAHVLCLHGGGASHRGRFEALRRALGARGVGSTALDCIGHGATGGQWADSSLQLREQQARAVMAHQQLQPTAVVGVSMGAYNAIQLSAYWPLHMLVLVVPGIYTPAAHRVPFGPAFSALIRQPRSWAQSDAFALLARFTGRLLVIAAQDDAVIPQEIPAQLYAAAAQAAHRELLVVPDTGHTGALERVWQSGAWRTQLLGALCDPPPAATAR